MTEKSSNSLFTKECISAINKAFGYAKEKKYEFLTIDNIMIFILQTKNGKKIFDAMKLDFSELKNKVEEYLHENISKFNGKDDAPIPTTSAQKLLKNAVNLKNARGKEGLADEEDILIALFDEINEHETFILNYFKHYDIKRLDIISYVSHGSEKDTQENSDYKKDDNLPYLNKYAINLNEKALAGKIDPLIGRADVIEKIITILCQRKKNNPLIIGDPGIGKTAIAEGLAQAIVDKKVPSIMEDYVIYSLDIPSLVAGTKYRGDLEERLKHVIKEASKHKNIVLDIEEIHNLIGAGGGSGGMDASNILKPALSSGEIKVIGTTTIEEYRKYFEKEPAFARRFKEIIIYEPSILETIEIIKGIKSEYEKFHNVKYELSAIHAAVNLTNKHMNNKKLPDKAIDILDMTASQAKIKGLKVIKDKDVSDIIAKILNIPVNDIQNDEKIKLKNLSSNLKSKIYGQNIAIDKVVDSIIYSRADLISKDKPVGSFLFTGPTGVGKTEVTRQISHELKIPLIRFDMSEYMEKHSVARLIGAPPGYVGHEQGGQLIDAIRKTPSCVLLLDEIEKAHPDVYDILLQIMDYAVLTDNHGKKADFKNCLLIMTSNVGAKEINKRIIGFTDEKNIEIDRDNEIKKTFRPEFYNRLDSVVHFHPLNEESILKIIKSQIKSLSNKLLEKKIVLFVEESVYTHILNGGFDEKYGARPIERFIENNISKKIAKDIVFGALEKGGEIKLKIQDKEIFWETIADYSLNKKRKSKEII